MAQRVLLPEIALSTHNGHKQYKCYCHEPPLRVDWMHTLHTYMSTIHTLYNLDNTYMHSFPQLGASSGGIMWGWSCCNQGSIPTHNDISDLLPRGSGKLSVITNCHDAFQRRGPVWDVFLAGSTFCVQLYVYHIYLIQYIHALLAFCDTVFGCGKKNSTIGLVRFNSWFSLSVATDVAGQRRRTGIFAYIFIP